MSEIKRLAYALLNKKELTLAEHLALVLNDNKLDSGSLIQDIMPIYWEKVDDRLRNLWPGNIYRPLYYVHLRGSQYSFKDNTRMFLSAISGHLEGCLLYLTSSPPEHRTAQRPFGRLVEPLRNAGILSTELADRLWKFNAAINVPSKHFSAYSPTRWLDERTFSVKEAAYAFLIMRKLSIELFMLIETHHIILPQSWPDFKDEWLSWSREINHGYKSTWFTKRYFEHISNPFKWIRQFFKGRGKLL